jgi:hypothetical protein
MSVAFALDAIPSASEDRWRAAVLAVPAVGLSLSGLQIASGPTFLFDGLPAAALAATLVCSTLALGLGGAALVALVMSVRRERGRSDDPGAAAGGRCSLIVDEAGVPGLRDPSEATVRSMSLQAWCTLPGLTVLTLAPYPGQPGAGGRRRPVTLALGRDALSDDAWRRLHVWLRWNERGRTDRQTLEPHRP